MMSDILLSIVIPAYNCKNYIQVCIEALLEQDLRQYEILIIDDGSTDGTAEICDELAQSSTIVRVFHKKNQGQGVARNFGISQAKGEYIAFVDSDDIPTKNAYGLALNSVRENKADLCVCNWKKVVSENEITRIAIPEDITVSFVKKEDAIYRMSKSIGYFSTAVWNKIYKLELIKNNNIRFQSERDVISEDYLFNYDYICLSNKIAVANIELYNYRVNDSSFCHRYQTGYFERLVRMKKYLDGKSLLSQQVDEAITEKLFSFIKTCIIQEVEFYPIFEAIKGIRYFCNHSIAREIINKVDYSSWGKRNKIIYRMINNNNAWGIYLLYKLKNVK